ncbi:hypothetical protein [Kytococcus sp. Marseille-QA3725]
MFKKILGVLMILLGLLWSLGTLLLQLAKLGGSAYGQTGNSVFNPVIWQNDPSYAMGAMVALLIMLAIGALLIFFGVRLFGGKRRAPQQRIH